MVQRKYDEISILREKAAAKLTKELEELHKLSAEELKMRYFEIPGTGERLKEFENKLNKEIEALRIIFDASPISIWNKDTKNNFIRVNKAAAKFVGREIDEIEGRSADEIFPLESEKYYIDDLEVMNSGKPKIGIIESVTTKGETKWVRTDKIPWYSPSGEIAGIIAFARDITKQRIAEQKLKDSEELYRKVITNAPISIFATDEKGIFTLHEGKAIERLGMKAGDNVGVSAFDLFSELKVIEHNGSVSTGKSVLDRVSKGEYLSGITELNGVIFDNQFAPIWDENNKVAGLLGVATDITDRKKTEAALRKSEEDLNEAQHLARIGSWDWDVTTDTIRWSKEYYRIYGFDPQKSPPGYKEHLKAYTPKSIEVLDNAVKNSMQTGACYEIDLELSSITGSTRWVRARGECKLDESGKIIGLRGTTQDITERKNLELKQQFQSEIALNISEGVSLVSENDGIIVYANRRFEEMFGYGTGELIGKHVQVINAPTSNLTAYDTARDIIASMQNKERCKIEVYNVKKDGTRFWTEASISQFDHPEYGNVLITVQMDIDKRKQIENKLIEHENDLQQLSTELINTQEKERKILAQELHDEVGQSLMALKIDIASIKKDLPPGINIKTYDRIIEMDTILDSVINQVHELSLNLRPATLDVLGLFPTIKSYCNQFSERTGIIVHLENDITINLDKEQEIHLFRIVQEALTNVVKHAQAENIFLNLKTKGNILNLSIQDDGCGFMLNKKESIPPIGIGLIGMRERVNSLKGIMEINTSPAKGTTIAIEIPINRTHE